MDFAERLRASFADLGQLLPALIGALIIVFAGYLLAKLLEKAIDRSVAKVGLNRWLERGGVMDAMAKTGRRFTSSRVLANIVFWLVMFVVLTVAANGGALTARVAVCS